MSHQDFEQFKVKRALWKTCLDGADRNSIFKQIHLMMWNAAVFNLLNESRKFAATDSKGRKEINGMIHSFMDRCFFDSQFLYIRRLTDSEDMEGSRGVFSLAALLKDMKANTALISRANLFLIDGLEYDYDLVFKKEMAYAEEQAKKGSASYWLPSEFDSYSILERHKLIDALSGTAEDRRQPTDFARVEIFDFLITKIKAASTDISLHVNKFIAHSATPESREESNADDIKITLNHFMEAHKVICQVANFLDWAIVSGASHGFLPMPQFDHLKFIERGIVAESDRTRVHEVWTRFHEETGTWSSWGLKDLKQEMENTLKGFQSS